MYHTWQKSVPWRWCKLNKDFNAISRNVCPTTEFWPWRNDVLVKTCGAIDSRSDLIRVIMEVDRRCLRPMKTVSCLKSSGRTFRFCCSSEYDLAFWHTHDGPNCNEPTSGCWISILASRQMSKTEWCIGDVIVSGARATFVTGDTASSVMGQGSPYTIMIIWLKCTGGRWEADRCLHSGNSRSVHHGLGRNSSWQEDGTVNRHHYM